MSVPTSQADGQESREGEAGFRRWAALLPVLQAFNLALAQDKDARGLLSLPREPVSRRELWNNALAVAASGGGALPIQGDRRPRLP